MKLFVGLGNPGARYERNRHNIGFMAADAIAAAHGFPHWRSKFQGRVAEGRLGGVRVVLLKPETYMNLSGDSVRAAAGFYKIAPEDVVVFHDELDLAPGRVRVKAGGGHAGHNGLRSLAAHLGPDFVRVRLGIGHPGDKRVVSNFVLADFAKSDEDWLRPLLEAIAEAAPDLAAGELSRFASRVGQAVPQPKPPRKPAAAAGASAPDVAPRPLRRPESAPVEPEPPTEPEPAEAAPARSALQRLIDRFR